MYRIFPQLVCLFLFFIFGTLFAVNRHTIKYFFWVIVFSVTAELVLGLGQLFGWLGNNDVNFTLGGSFGNPGAYAGYLAVISPLILSILLYYKRIKRAENLYYGLVVCFVFLLFLLFKSDSRGAWVACALGCFIVLNHRYCWGKKIKGVLHTPLSKVCIGVFAVFILFIGGFILYNYKADSAFGRLLVWKVTASVPHSNLLSGNGIGAFEANYGKWQAAYFAEENGSEAERYVADYVTCAYNEFIEILIEQGGVVLFLFVALFLFAFRQKSKISSPFTIGVKASLAALLILMCVSYPLRNIPLFLYFIFCLAVILPPFKKEIHSQKINNLSLVRKLIFIFIGLFIMINACANLYGHHYLRKGQQYVFSNNLDKGLKAYNKADNLLADNGVFQFYYGSVLTFNQQYEEGIDRLELSVRKSSNPNSYILLGNNYKEIGEVQRAEQAYLTIINMIPSRLYPKYLLAKLYMDVSEYEKAEKMAVEILNTEEKVPTTAAREIKNEMKLFINSRKK